MAQRNHSAAILSWVRNTMNHPADFPTPTGEEMAQLRPGPNGSMDAESLLCRPRQRLEQGAHRINPHCTLTSTSTALLAPLSRL